MNAQLEVKPNAGSHVLVPSTQISQDCDGWILLKKDGEWVDIPPDDLLQPYGLDLPTPTRPQIVTIGRWLKGTS